MPDYIKFLMKHALIGATAALSFVAILMYWNVMNLWHLVSTSADGLLALTVMTVFFVITFSSVQMGIAVMALGDKDSNDKRPRGPRIGTMIPVKVAAKAQQQAARRSF